MLKKPRQQLQKNKEDIIKKDKEKIKNIPKLIKRLRSIYV
jgi:hypothetical protein